MHHQSATDIEILLISKDKIFLFLINSTFSTKVAMEFYPYMPFTKTK